MSLRNRLIGTGLALGLTLGFGTSALAQQPAAQEQQPPAYGTPKPRQRGGHQRMGGLMRMLRELNLTQAQEQQARAILERHRANTTAQRDELRQLHEQRGQGTLDAATQERVQALRQELHASMKQMHEELLALLTPEQRATLEQKKQEHKARRQQMRERRLNDQDDDQ